MAGEKGLPSFFILFSLDQGYETHHRAANSRQFGPVEDIGQMLEGNNVQERDHRPITSESPATRQ
jgi:hypothetical protein